MIWVMKRILVVMVAVLLLAGCGGTASKPAPTATLTSKQFGFSLVYDRSKLSARIDHDVGASGTWIIPGVGTVSGPTLVLILNATTPHGVAQNVRGEWQLTVARYARLPHSATLAAFAHEPFLRSLEAKGGRAVTSRPPGARSPVTIYISVPRPPQMVTIDGLPAFHYTTIVKQGNRQAHSEDYVLYHGGFVYAFNLAAADKYWPTNTAMFNAVLQSFRVTR